MTQHARPHHPVDHDQDSVTRARPPATPADLRLKRQRELAQLLVDRAAAAELPPADLALLTAVYADGKSAVDIAALTGRPGDPALIRSLRRRIRRLAHRVMDPKFVYVLRHAQRWPATRRKVAHATIIQGRSLRQAARHLGLSLHVIRRHHDAILALFETALAVGPPTTRRSA